MSETYIGYQIYKGCQIIVFWRMMSMGYHYRVLGKGNEMVAESVDAFFYEEDAWEVAKELVDQMQPKLNG